MSKPTDLRVTPEDQKAIEDLFRQGYETAAQDPEKVWRAKQAREDATPPRVATPTRPPMVARQVPGPAGAPAIAAPPGSPMPPPAPQAGAPTRPPAPPGAPRPTAGPPMPNPAATAPPAAPQAPVVPKRPPADATRLVRAEVQTLPLGRLLKAGPYIGPKGGKWADPEHTVSWKPTGPETSGQHSLLPRLPEDPWRYFERKDGAVMVPLDKLRPVRARPEGIEHAGQYMRQAYDGQGAKRDPIGLRDHGDGTYSILSGNSTYAQAKQNGWRSLPAVVDQQLSRAVTDLEAALAARRGKLKPMSAAEHVTVAKRARSEHQQRLDANKETLRRLAPPGAHVDGRIKKLDSIIGKLVRKPDNYATAQDLNDVTGLRVVVDTTAKVYQTIEALKREFEVVEFDDRIAKPFGEFKYRSIHMIIRDRDGLLKELQVRTERQHTVSVWTHDLYKPQTAEQERALSTHGAEAIRYAANVSDHAASKDRGEKPPDPPLPPCPPFVSSVFTCPEV